MRNTKNLHTSIGNATSLEDDEYTSQFNTTVAGGSQNEIPKVAPPKVRQKSVRKSTDRRQTVAGIIKANSRPSAMEEEFAKLRESRDNKT